jgi:hypothetical protein
MRIIILFLAITSLANAQTPSELAKKATRFQRQDVLLGKISQWPYLQFEHGKFVGYDSLAGKVGIIEADGSGERQIAVQIPEATKVGINDVSLQANGSLLVAGWAAKADGTWASIIAEYSGKGELNRIVRLDNFAADHICSVENGKVWALGRDKEAEAKKEAPIASYSMLREFSMERGELTSSFQKKSDGHEFPYAMDIACTKTGVFAYFPTTGTVLEYRFKDGLVKERKGLLAPLGKYNLTGFAVSDTGTAYLSFVKYENEGKLSKKVTNIFAMDLATGSNFAKMSVLLDDQGQSLSPSVVKLIGVSGQEVLMKRGPEEIVSARY